MMPANVAPLVLDKPSETPTLREIAKRARLDIGTCVTPSFLSEASYKRILGREFSVLEAENAMKFGPIHPEAGRYDFAASDLLADFAKAHRMKMRGHTLVWHNQNAPWIEGLAADRLAEALRDHIETVMGRYAGRIYAWDVVNEAFNTDGSLRSTVWYDMPGIGLAGEGTRYIEQAFRWAREADPKAKLFYNDYDAEPINAKSNAMYEMAKELRRRRAPLDGVGLQGHLNLAFNRPEILASFENNLARFAKLGLEIHITELDVRLTDGSEASLEAQAELYRKVIEICRRQPKVKLIQIWGFTDRHSWIPGWYKGQGWALPWDEEYRPKPALEAIRKSMGDL